MALLQTHLVFFIAAIIIVVRLFSHDRLKRLVFLGLRGWTEDLSPGEVQAAVALYGKGPSHEAFLAELERLRSPPRVYEWRDSLVPSVRSWSRASGLDEEPSRWVHTGELLSLLNLCLLLAFSYVLVGSYECLEGSGGVPSYHVTLLAACTLGTALAYLAMPLWSMGVRHLDVTLALSLGSVASVICTLGYAYLYSATRAGARDIPWVDLGAPLGQGIDATLGPARGPLLAGAGVALFTLVTATLLVTPALRAARYFSARMEAAQALPGGGRWAKAAARVGMYAPALVAALWFRPLISVTAHDAVPCSPLLQALSSSPPAATASSWGVGVSRDCRASLASQGSAGGESLLGLLPLWAVQLLPGEGWAAYASSTLARHYWIGESSWLRWRAAAVLTAACGGMLWQWRGLLQAHLDCAWVDGGRQLARAGRRAAAGKAPGPCTASHGPGAACPRPAPECSLKEARMKGLFTLSQAAMQLLAVPAVLGSLSVLLTRGTGLGGVGACHTGRRLVEGVLGVAGRGGSSGKAAAAAAAAASTDSLTWVLAEAGKVLFGPAFTGQLLAARQDLTITVLSPALWRPVLSYLLLCTLLLWWVLGELGLMYWRVAASSVEEAEEREEEREEESRKEAEAEAAAAKAKAAAAAKAPRAAAIVEDVD